jgi:hypothetical protein
MEAHIARMIEAQTRIRWTIPADRPFRRHSRIPEGTPSASGVFHRRKDSQGYSRFRRAMNTPQSIILTVPGCASSSATELF